MKKIATAVAAVAMAVGLTACGGNGYHQHYHSSPVVIVHHAPVHITHVHVTHIHVTKRH